MVEEDQNNIVEVCSDCIRLMYPDKGNFDIKIGDFAKIRFEEEHGREFMWIKVKKANGDMFEGILDNDPVLMKNIICGDKVTFSKEDVYERIRE